MISSNGEVQYSPENMAIDDFLDTTLLTNEDISAILSSTNSTMFIDNNGALDPNNGLEKPVKKRSRASKHTPASTFLIAKASDFRALVQQLTGCQSAESYKGPINLNFGAAQEDEVTDIDKVSTIPMLEFNFYNQKTQAKNQHQQEHQQQQQQQQHDQDDQRLYEEQEISSSNGGNTLVSSYSSPGPYSMTRDDHLALDDILMNDSFDYAEYSSNGIVTADHHATIGDHGDYYSSDYRFADDNILFL